MPASGWIVGLVLGTAGGAAATAAGAAPAGDSTALLWGFLLFAGAIFCTILELFVPSGGMLGLLSGLLAISSLVAFFFHDSRWGLAFMGVYAVLIPAFIAFFFKVWVHTPIGRRMVLSSTVTGQVESEEGETLPDQASVHGAAARALVGAHGVAETTLRPVGTIRLAGKRIDAIAESGIIEARSRVVVTEVYDNQIKVRLASDEMSGPIEQS